MEKLRQAFRQPWVSTRLYVLLMLGLFPLLGGSYGQITAVKTTSFLVLTGLFFLCLGLELLRWRPGPLPTSFSLYANQWCLVLLALAALAAALCSPYAAQTWTGAGRSGGLLMLWLYIGLALVLSRLDGLRPLYVYVLAGAVLLMLVIILLQLLGKNPLGLYPAGLTYYDAGRRYPGAYLGTIGNLNQLSPFFCLAVPLLLGQVRLDRGLRRWVLACLALACCAVAVLARMEAALLGLGLGLLLTAPCLSRDAGLRRLLYLLLGLVLCGLLLLAVFLPGPTGSSWWQLHRILWGCGEDGFGTMRWGIWRAAWSLIRRRPVIGWGPDLFRLLYGGMFPEGSLIDSPHNEYLAYWCDCGLLGLAAYLAALALSILRWTRASRRDPRFLLPLAMAWCYGVQAAFTFSTPLVAPLWWVLWGLGMGMETEKAPRPRRGNGCKTAQKT